MIKVTAPGRASIIGNPTDGYGGTVISCSIKNRAEVTIDYKPGVTEGNQENGVKQMLSVAKSREKSKTGM